MNRLALIAVTGVFTLMLTACGEQGTSKPAENTAAPQQRQTTAPAEAPKAAPEQAPQQPATGGEQH